MGDFCGALRLGRFRGAQERGITHLHRERLEAYQTKILYQLADRHVQCTKPGRGGRQCIFEMREVLHFGVKIQIEVCFKIVKINK